MSIKNIIFSISMALFVTACGGGSSSSGGSDNGVRVFTGTQNIIVSARGVSEVGSSDFVLEADGNNITIRDEDFIATGVANAGNFSITSPMFTLEVDAQSRCTGSVTYTGTIIGVQVTGDLAGSFDCGFATVRVTGRFDASTNNRAKSLQSSLSDILKSIKQQGLRRAGCLEQLQLFLMQYLWK